MYAAITRAVRNALIHRAQPRLIKLDNRLMGFLMLNLIMAMFYTRLGEKIVRLGGAVQSADLEEALEHFPEHLLSARRKKRAYISSSLSKYAVKAEQDGGLLEITL